MPPRSLAGQLLSYVPWGAIPARGEQAYHLIRRVGEEGMSHPSAGNQLVSRYEDTLYAIICPLPLVVCLCALPIPLTIPRIITDADRSGAG